jgi:peptidoglycan/LPS O-acetylase OafA/YrhL
MSRLMFVIGMLALLTSAWLLFEVQNIWQSNADRVVILGLMFALGAGATVASFTFGRSRSLPPTLMASTFVGTIVYSYSVLTVSYVMTATLIVALIALLACFPKEPPVR